MPGDIYDPTTRVADRKLSKFNSGSLSTLNCLTPPLIARCISSFVLPPRLTVAIPEETVAVNPDCTKLIKVTPAPIVVPPD